MADSKALPVFGFTDDTTQLEELRAYLNKKGAKLDASGPADLPDNLIDLCQYVHLLGKVENEADMILSSISSLFISVSDARAFEVISAFCKQLTPEHFTGYGWASTAGAAVRVLSNLFLGFAKHPKIQQTIFIALLDMCSESRLIGEMDTREETLNNYFKAWSSDTTAQRAMLRQLHGALLADQRADQAAKVMIALLETYTTTDAASAIDDARECVRTAVVDPASLCFDHVVRLAAVRLLEKSDPLMHDILQIFTSGTLRDYKAFVAKNPNFVDTKLKVAEAILVKKIRLLTLMSMAERSQVIPLSELSSELDMSDSEELEEFIIESIQINAISGKLNEMTHSLHVSTFQHREFGRPQWQALHSRLKTLIGSIQQAHENIKSVNQVTIVS